MATGLLVAHLRPNPRSAMVETMTVMMSQRTMLCVRKVSNAKMGLVLQLVVVVSVPKDKPAKMAYASGPILASVFLVQGHSDALVVAVWTHVLWCNVLEAMFAITESAFPTTVTSMAVLRARVVWAGSAKSIPAKV